MNDATLLIKKIPADLKQWLAKEAAQHDRSMNREAIRLLEEARTLRESESAHREEGQSVDQILKRLRALPVLDNRPMEEILYDEAGMPK
jgi:plasmid stability protein